VNTVNFVTIPSSIVPDQEILVFGARRLTYADLNDHVARLCAVFKQFGLAHGDVVALLDTNSDLYIECYYAAAKAGLVFLPLNYRAKDAELEYMINTAQAKALLVGDRYLEQNSVPAQREQNCRDWRRYPRIAAAGRSDRHGHAR
jgi:fatty-acyl-CoA synthase